jgi:hypothetical protein
MGAYRDYWLFPSPHGKKAEETMPAVQEPFESVEDARQAAMELGGEMDILGAPTGGGTLQLVEHVAAP